ncbi:MAG TPA: PQQ-binding-like beta-propeller repeat protein, partial [Planctomycetota bacterium]|nr:PQQ-binding-like beta-propeller repeat protein [Planctomycetota bacterium]
MNPLVRFGVAAWAALLATSASAQWGTVSSLHTSKVSVADDLALDPLEVARRATEAGDLDKAIATYQDLLDRMSDLVWHAVKAPRSGGETERILEGDRFVGLRKRVHDLLKALPGDGFARYLAREGPRAEADLERAAAARDEEALRRLVRTRFLTPAGPRALAALADLGFEDGRPEDAALYAERLAFGEPDADLALRARAVARAALARFAAGDGARLRELRRRLDEPLAQAPIVAGDSAAPLGAFVDGLAARLPAPAASVAAAPAFGSRPWPPVRLTVQHGKRLYDNEERFLSFDQYFVEAGFTYAPIIPAIADAAIFVNDGLSLRAINLYTGKTLWTRDGRAPNFQGRRNWNVTYEPVVDRGVVFAYLEDEPQIREDKKYEFNGFIPIETIVTRKLYAVDAQTGETLWTHARLDGAKNADERAFLARLSVSTPPLVLGERLYVGGSYYHGGFRHWLCAFDRRTGAIVWRTFVALGQAEQNMFGRQVKDSPPGLVAERDGLLVYSTNIGVVAAVDAATGAPRWVSAYEQEPIPSVDGPVVTERAPGWAPHRPIFHGDDVYLGPVDALDFLAFRTSDGACRRVRDPQRNESARRTRFNGLRHVIGLYDGAIVLAGKLLIAFDVTATGSQGDATLKWKAAPLENAGLGVGAVDGKPAVAGDRVWFCVHQPGGRGGQAQRPRLFAVHLGTGKYVEEHVVEGRFGSGNLVFGDDAAVVAGGSPDAAYLSGFVDVQRATARLEAAAVENPDDPRLRYRLGQLRLQAEDYPEAVKSFERSLAAALAQGAKGDAAAAAARQALYAVYLNLAVESTRTGLTLPPSSEERFALAAKYASTPRQRTAVAVAKLAWSLRVQRPAATYDVARHILRDFADEETTLDGSFVDVVPALSDGARVKAGVAAALAAAAAAERARNATDAVAFYGEALRRFPQETVVRNGETLSVWRYAYEAVEALLQSSGRGAYAAQEAEAKRLLEEARAEKAFRKFEEVVEL